MKRTALPIVALSLMAAPALADPGKDQYAATLGVQADLYTMSELIRLDEALSDNDLTTVRWIESGGLKSAPPEDPARVTAAEAQLAASLGLDPAQYTSAELAALYAEWLAD